MPPPANYFYPTDDYYGGFAGGGGFGVPTPPRGPSLFGYNMASPSGPMEGVAQAVMPMLAEMLRREFGGAAFQFGGDQNVLSSQYAQQYLQHLNNARTAGAAQDTAQVRQLMAGVARMLGNDLTDPGVRRSIDVLSRDASGMLPVLASMFPDSIDRMFPRGSMTVAAQSFTSAGRFVYDPMTGAPIMTDPGYGPRVVGGLLSRGPEATAGLGAGRLGQLFESLVGQGLVGSGSDLRADVVSGATSGEAARGVQADRVSKQIERYSKTVAAINDIFAENGQANRPMAELIRGLQTLTQGGFGVVDPTTLAQTVRTAQALSRVTGVGYDQLAAFGQASSAALVGGGMGRRPAGMLGTQIGQYMAMVGGATRDSGLVFEGPEGQTQAEASGRAGRLAAAGYTSDFGRLVGAVLALDQGAAAGTPVRSLADAIRAGRTDATLPGGGAIDLRTAGFDALNAVVVGSGLGGGALLNQLAVPRQLDAALADPKNAGARDAIRLRQVETLRQDFLRQLVGVDWQGSVTAANPEAVFAAVMAAASSGKNLSDGAVVNEIGDRFGMSPAERTLLRTQVLGRIAPDGRFTFADLGPRPGLANLGAMVGEQERAMGAATALMRGGWLRNVGVAVAEYAGGGKTMMGTLLRGLGLVGDEELDAALGGTGGVGRAIGGALGEGGLPVAPAPRAVGGRVGAAPARVELKIDIARIEQVGQSMTISGGGAMFGGGSAT